MEEILRQVLSSVQGIEAGIKEIRSDISELKTRVGNLEQGQAELKAEVAEIKAEVAEVKAELKDVKQLGLATFNQAGMLTEFRTETQSNHKEVMRRLGVMDTKIAILAERSLSNEAELIQIRKASCRAEVELENPTTPFGTTK